MTTDALRSPADFARPASTGTSPLGQVRPWLARAFRRYCEARMRTALGMMTDAELARVGIARRDIPKVAAEAARIRG